MKNMGVTCNGWKADKFRKRLLERGFNLIEDKPLDTEGKVHLFTIECEDEDFHEMALKLASTLKQLQIEVKQSN